MNDEIVKLIATLHSAAIAFESIRLSAGQRAKDLESLKNDILNNIIDGKTATENKETIENSICQHVNELSKKMRNLVDSINGINKPGVIPLNVQLDLFLDGLPGGDLDTMVYNPSRRSIMHRSGAFQPPKSLQESLS